MRSYTSDQVQNKFIGKVEPEYRNQLEYELQMALIRKAFFTGLKRFLV